MLMNGQTKAENIQAFFARNLNKLGRDLMGPPVGKTVNPTDSTKHLDLKIKFRNQQILRKILLQD